MLPVDCGFMVGFAPVPMNQAYSPNVAQRLPLARVVTSCRGCQILRTSVGRIVQVVSLED